jgi:sulfatase maturation enzyme AslB (radical SAM superfamily)
MAFSQAAAVPVWLWIDPTRRCNLSCSLCYTKDGQGEENMELGMFNTILDNVLSESRIDIRQLTLNWRGEPMLNRSLVHFLDALQERNVTFPVEFHTNATALTSRRAEELVASKGNFTICISIDGGNQASHDLQRGDGTYQRSLAGAWLLLKARKHHMLPRIVLHQLDLNIPLDDYDAAFLDLARATDEWQKKSPIIPGGERRLFAQPNDSPPEHIIVHWKSALLPWSPPEGACFWAGNALFIAPNANVSICLLSSSQEGVLGNLAAEPVWGILQKAKVWRAKLEESSRKSIAHCQSCRMETGDIKEPM